LALVLLTAATFQIEAAEQTYRFFMFEPTKLRSGTANSASISEFDFKFAGADLDLTSVTVTNPGGNNPLSGNENPDKVKDNATTTKWLDFNKKPLVFDFGDGNTATIDGYNFATSNDAQERDPVSWILYGGSDGVNWTPIDIRQNVAVTTARQTFQTGFALPDSVPPYIASYSTSKTVAINGDTTLTADWNTLVTDSVTISGVAGTFGAVGSTPISPPDNADTTYTLTATSAQGTSQASGTVRTVVGGSATYSFVRFTPVKLRDGVLANSVQLSEFRFKNGVTDIPIVAAFNEVGGNSPANEGPDKLFDNNVATKWLDFSKGAVIFDLGGTPATFDSYGFTTANDGDVRDPVRWILEGSDDSFGPWNLIDNLTAFDFQTPVARQTVTQDIPLPGSSIVPFAIMTGDTTVVAGEPITLVWKTSGASTVTISGVPGTLDPEGSIDVFPAADTTYTLSATSGGPVVTADVVVDVITPAITEIAYENFDGSGDELALMGWASVMNDFALRPAPADANRLRITPDEGSTNGTAWFRKRIDTSSGFETEFDLHIVRLGGAVDSGADGMAFVIHNHPLRTQAAPAASHENGLPSNAINICFDSYNNGGVESAAAVSVREGNLVTARVELPSVPKLKLGGTPAVPDLTQTSGSAAPYRVRVGYNAPETEGNPGTVYVTINGYIVLEGVEVNMSLAEATDENGLSYVGFTGRTGGLFEAHDVTSWFLVEGVPAPPFRELSSVITPGNPPSVNLQWTSGGQHTYRIASSTDMIDWSNEILGNIAPSGTGVNSANVNFPSGDRVFIRVEEE
jgi:hypothetical protein